MSIKHQALETQRTCEMAYMGRLQTTVIARSEATKQSIFLRGAMDCFAEPVIGRAFARPVGSQWRVSHAAYSDVIIRESG